MDNLHAALDSGQISSFTALQDFVSNSGLSPTEQASAIAVGMQKFGIQRVLNQWSQSDAEQSAMKAMTTGAITSQSQFEAQYAGQLNWDVYARLDKAFLSKAKWATPANMAALDGAVKRNNLSQEEKGRLMDMINRQAATEANKGNVLNTFDIANIANDAAAKVKTSRIPYVGEITKVDIPNNISRNDSDKAFYDSNGNQVSYDSDTNSWTMVGK